MRFQLKAKRVPKQLLLGKGEKVVKVAWRIKIDRQMCTIIIRTKDYRQVFFYLQLRILILYSNLYSTNCSTTLTCSNALQCALLCHSILLSYRAEQFSWTLQERIKSDNPLHHQDSLPHVQSVRCEITEILLKLFEL